MFKHRVNLKSEYVMVKKAKFCENNPAMSTLVSASRFMMDPE